MNRQRQKQISRGLHTEAGNSNDEDPILNLSEHNTNLSCQGNGTILWWYGDITFKSKRVPRTLEKELLQEILFHAGTIEQARLRRLHLRRSIWNDARRKIAYFNSGGRLGQDSLQFPDRYANPCVEYAIRYVVTDATTWLVILGDGGPCSADLLLFFDMLAEILSERSAKLHAITIADVICEEQHVLEVPRRLPFASTDGRLNLQRCDYVFVPITPSTFSLSSTASLISSDSLTSLFKFLPTSLRVSARLNRVSKEFVINLGSTWPADLHLQALSMLFKARGVSNTVVQDVQRFVQSTADEMRGYIIRTLRHWESSSDGHKLDDDINLEGWDWSNLTRISLETIRVLMELQRRHQNGLRIERNDWEIRAGMDILEDRVEGDTLLVYE
ncbi:hypothetical protein BV898_05992 [Hypsibius exemplaris]|uniref:Uncharacterized protein n=1 Tax=Hypsibius exemplaris TaxID=2072580 RepID=A0A1W0WXQ8_HYPEX|nr:hypothetical protein BV898_05992 [Hypsibius exemplaris]